MIDYVVQRFFLTALTILILSIGIFAIVQIPQGDAVDTIVASRQAQGDVLSEEEIVGLREMYGINQPLLPRYVKWMFRLLHGDLGLSVRG